jgi:transposase InsO family protein
MARAVAGTIFWPNACHVASTASNGWCGRMGSRFSGLDEGPQSVIAAKVFNRQFTADGPNQEWVADFTHIWTAEGWLSVAAVIDLFSRRVVADR